MSPIRIAGTALAAISAMIIIYNVSQSNYNRQIVAAIRNQGVSPEVRGIPVEALAGGISGAYTFTPPFSGFEILVLLGGAAGVVMIILGKNKSN